MARACVAVFVVLGACGGVGSGASKPAGGGPPAVEAASTAAREQASGAPPAGAASSVASAVTLTAEVEEDGRVALVLQNRDAAPVRVAADVAVERMGASAFEAFAPTALALRFACDVPPVACLELVPGAELRPPPWLASAGRAQCNERGAEHAPAGRYRFVARTCEGARVEGAAFELGAVAATAAP